MLRGRTVLGLFLIAGCAAVTSARADNWPRFRGPNGTGVANGQDLPVHFGEQSGILWKTPLPGLGNSSPVVWGDRLFLQTSSDDGRERSLLCLSVADGKILWSRSVPGRRAAKHPKNTYASSTPATDGERVYACFWDGKDVLLAAYDFDGKKLWDRNLGPFRSQHGVGASPIVYRDKVIFANDQDARKKDGEPVSEYASTLLALSGRDGSIVWQVPRLSYRACYSAPFLRKVAGAPPELVLVSTTEVTGYDPETGAKNWSWHWKFATKMPLRMTGSPAYHESTLFAISGDGNGDRQMAAVRLDGTGTQTKPQLRWENRKNFPYVPSLLAHGDYVFFVNDLGIAGCFAAKTGKRVWFERLKGARSFIASPVLVDGKIYAASEDGDVFVLAAEPTFKLLARNPLGEPVSASPAVADRRLFIRGEHHLFCIGKRAGR
jgi:outer membrane protein assembly factor BamB